MFWIRKEKFYIALYIAYGAGRYIDQQSGRGLYLRYPVILCINFAFYKRSICTETEWVLSARCKKNGAQSATIKSRALGALKLAREARNENMPAVTTDKVIFLFFIY